MLCPQATVPANQLLQNRVFMFKFSLLVAQLPLPVTFDKLGEAFAGASVVQREAGLTLLLHAEAGRLHLGKGEAEVLVQIVQLVDEVAHITPQHLHQDTRVQQR